MRTATVRNASPHRHWDLSDLESNADNYALRLVGQPLGDRFTLSMHERAVVYKQAAGVPLVPVWEFRLILACRLVLAWRGLCDVRTPNRSDDAQLTADWATLSVVNFPEQCGLELVRVR